MINTKIYNVDKYKYLLLENYTNDLIFRTLKSGKIWEEQIVGIYKKYIKLNNNIIDIGANIGTHTVIFADIVGNNGTVIAFEPQRFIYQILNANVALNGFTNVYTFNNAIGEKNCNTFIQDIDYYQDTNRIEPGNVEIAKKSNTPIQMYELDYFEFDNVDFIKIDVEKYEPYVILGAKKTIEKCRPIVLFELTTLPHKGFDRFFVVEYFKTLDYNVSYINPPPYDYDYIAIPKEKL